MASVDAAYAASMVKMPTPKLTRLLQAAVEKQAPPRHGIFRPKLRYAHQGGNNPPIIVIHGNALDHVPDAYRRYLERTFMEAFKLKGTPLRVEFRSTRNPYADKGALIQALTGTCGGFRKNPVKCRFKKQFLRGATP
jgi:GTP-binding protein